MATDDFFRARLDGMVDPRDSLVILGSRLPWAQIEAAIETLLAHKNRAGRLVDGADLFGPTAQLVGGGASNAGRLRLPIRLMAALLYLKHAYGLSDGELVQRWSENVVWQHFSGNEYYTPRPRCDATQLGRFRGLLGEEGVEMLLKTTIESAVQLGAIDKSSFSRVIVDSTVQEKALAHSVDTRFLEKARDKVVKEAKATGIAFPRTDEAEGRKLLRKASGYARAKQMRRLAAVHKRQRTSLGRVLRHTEREVGKLASGACANARSRLHTALERASKLHGQQRGEKGKRTGWAYALHAPEVAGIGKGKARKLFEFGVKVSLAVTLEGGLVVGARSFPGNPYDGHTLAAQVEQSNLLLQDLGAKVKTAVTDLGYRGMEGDNAGLHIVQRGKAKTLSPVERTWLKRRQAIEPLIGHLKADHGMQRCWLKGSTGDALHAVLCAAGFNIRCCYGRLRSWGSERPFCA